MIADCPEDIASAELCHAGYRAIAASVIGPSHRESGTFRQDYYVLTTAGSFVLAIAADGLGSARYSHVAARYACEEVASKLSHRLAKVCPTSGAADVERELRVTLREIASIFDGAEDRGAPGPMYTTILGAVCGHDYVVAFNFGDGAVAVFDCTETHVCHCFLGPEHGDFVGQVFPLLTEGFEEHLRISCAPRGQRVFISTDGVADFALLDDETSLKLEFLQSFDSAVCSLVGAEAPMEITAYLGGQRASAVNGDDKTLIWIQSLGNAAELG